MVTSGAEALKRLRSRQLLGGMSLADYGFYILCGAAVVWLLAEAVISPGKFAQVMVFGITEGAIYALVALGYTMVYGIIELINFAHGDVFTLSAYIGTTILGFFAVTENAFTVLNLIALIVVFPVVMLIMGGINVTIERVAYRPLRNAPRLAPLITAIGMSFFIEGVMFLWKGPGTVHFPNILPQWTTKVGGVFFGFRDVFVVVVAAFIAVIWWVLRRGAHHAETV